MNAPQDFQATLDHLPISCIRPSPFKAQTLRRSHFSTVKMLELAASISANGVLQPILVRPVNGGVGIQYEIVAGERRYIAADRQRLLAQRAKEVEREKIELEFRTRLLKQIHAKWKPPLKKQDLETIADAMLEGAENSDAYDAIYGVGRPAIEKMKEPDIQRWMVIYAINHECEVWNVERGQKAPLLLAYAQRLKIDVKKLRAEVVKDLKPVSAAPEAETTPAKAKSKKKAVKK